MRAQAAAKKYAESTAGDLGIAANDDLDAPVSEQTLAQLWETFEKTYQLNLGSWRRPSNQLISRLLREFLKNRWTVHKLSKAVTAYHMQCTPTSRQRKTTIVDGVDVTTGHHSLVDLPTTSLLDVMLRLEILYLAFAVIGTRPHEDASHRESDHWFSLTSAFNQIDFLREKLLNGKLISLDDFIQREIAMRAAALELVQGSRKLSLANAFKEVRRNNVAIWVNLYTHREGMHANTPLFENPLLHDRERSRTPARGRGRGGDGGSGRKGGRDGSGTSIRGADRAATKAEISKNGQAFPLKRGLTSSNVLTSGRACGAFADGRGCPRPDCGGVHCCHILKNKSDQFSQCLGHHSRVNCPLNK